MCHFVVWFKINTNMVCANTVKSLPSTLSLPSAFSLGNVRLKMRKTLNLMRSRSELDVWLLVWWDLSFGICFPPPGPRSASDRWLTGVCWHWHFMLYGFVRVRVHMYKKVINIDTRMWMLVCMSFVCLVCVCVCVHLQCVSSVVSLHWLVVFTHPREAVQSRREIKL